MPLFPTDPTFTNSDAQPACSCSSTHSFEFKAQVPAPNGSYAGEWVGDESLDSDGTGYNQKIVIKHTEGPTINRRLISLRYDFPVVDESLKGITVNMSVVSNKEHTLAQVHEVLESLRALIGDTTFSTNFTRGLI
jgi:hypothetical protein